MMQIQMSGHRQLKRVVKDMNIFGLPPKKSKLSVANAKYFSTEKENVIFFQKYCEGIEHDGLYFLSLHT